MKLAKAIELYKHYGIAGIVNASLQKLSRELKETILDFGIQPLVLKRRIKHLYGPAKIAYNCDELIVLCLIRNGELYIHSFMEHYLRMGIKHFVFMDNCSTDRTLEMLRSYDCVTVLQTDVKFIQYENTIRRYLAERFSQGRWCLTSDIDELLDYPYSDQLSLSQLLQYLNRHRYTAVIAQMLDMFSEQPLADLSSQVDDFLIKKYPYYDISDIDKTVYSCSKPANSDIKMFWGGIRKTVFGTYSGLTKAALVKMEGNIKTFVGWHHARNAQVADISCVLYHYPFLSSFYEKARDAIQTERYGKRGRTDFYEKIWRKLEGNPQFGFKLPTADRLSNINQLIDQNFIVVSRQYQQWVDQNESVLPVVQDGTSCNP